MAKTHKHKHQPAREVQFCSCGAMRTNDVEWVEGKDPNAVMLSAKAIAKSTPEERSEKASAAVTKRWKGKTRKERTEYMREIASRPRPSRRVEDRCECGRFTRVQAEKRGHVCGKALVAQLEAKLAAVKEEAQPPWTTKH